MDLVLDALLKHASADIEPDLVTSSSPATLERHHAAIHKLYPEFPGYVRKAHGWLAREIDARGEGHARLHKSEDLEVAVKAAGVSTTPWGSIGEGDYADAADYCSASLIDMNQKGTDKIKGMCKLPVREPRAMGGRVNRGGIAAAAAALAGARSPLDAPAEQKRAAARKLIRLYGEIDEAPPDALKRIAGAS